MWLDWVFSTDCPDWYTFALAALIALTSTQNCSLLDGQRKQNPNDSVDGGVDILGANFELESLA